MAPILVILACGTVFIGALTQRMSGLGFALVASPLLVVVLGPATGVSVGNALSAILCVVVLATSWRGVRWKRVIVMVAPALLTIPLGSLVVRTVPPAPLTILVGSIALVAITTLGFSERIRLLPGPAGAVVSGGLSGFMNVTAGIGGPALAVHALSDRWPRDVFVGTGQVFFLVINLLSIATKGVPHIDLTLWLTAVVALVAGVLLGHRLNRYVSQRTGRILVLALAGVGSASALVRGILALHS